MNTSITPRWLQTSLCVGALAVLSLAPVYCGSDSGAVIPGEEARDQEAAADAAADGTFLDETEAGAHERIRGMVARDMLPPEAGRRISTAIVELKEGLLARVADGGVSEDEALTEFRGGIRRYFGRALQRVGERGPGDGETGRDGADGDEAADAAGSTDAARAEATRIREAAAAGEMTEEEARQALLGIRFRIAAVEIRKAIADGEITEEEGRERLAALRERMAASRGEGGR